jgi:ATP-dependent Clp protease protease subunit
MAKKKHKKNSGNQAQAALVISQAALNALSLGYDFEHRAIYLFGPIDKMTAYRFIAGFKWLDRTPGPIHILLNSEGGDAEGGMAIYECLRTANNPTMIEAMGIVASAAVPILVAGTVRFLNPETKVMIHEVTWYGDGAFSTPVIHSLSKETEKMNRRYHEILAERTGKSVKDIEKWCADETYMDCAEAIKFGFADKVLDQRAYPKSFEAGMAEVNGAPPSVVPSATSQADGAKKAKKKTKK